MTAAVASTQQQQAERVLAVLVEAGATHRERCMPDREIARRAGVSARRVIDLCRVIAAELGAAVLAECVGQSKGRYVSHDPAEVERYADALHARGVDVLGRESVYRRLAERMKQRMRVEPDGQMRMWA